MTRARREHRPGDARGRGSDPAAEIGAPTNVGNARSMIHELISGISNKTVARIIELLSNATELSFDDLLGSLDGASRTRLSATLRDLVRGGLVQPYPGSAIGPWHVYYRLTDHGKSLAPAIQNLCRWTESNMPHAERNTTIPTGSISE